MKEKGRQAIRSGLQRAINHGFKFRYAAWLGVMLALAGVVMAQRPPNKVLVVNGRTSTAAVTQIGGHSYVDIEALAQITNGSVSFEANRIILTIPSSNPADGGPDAQQKLSKEFAGAALGELAQMREWKAAIETMIKFQVPADSSWFQDYHDRANEGLRLAKVAVTNSDQIALQLLGNEFNNLSQWAANAVDQRRALNATRTMSPDVLQNDEILQKLSTCAQFLGSMLASGISSDNPACH